MLYIVATPIGNLEDITLRALETLKNVDLIAAEDTRTSGILLKKYQIQVPLKSFHSHSDDRRLLEIIQLLEEGKKVALITDAGTPGISDPGFRLVAAAQARKIKVVPIPGPSAFLTALSASGLPINRFTHLGFLPLKKGRKTLFEKLQHIDNTLVFYESPHRIQKTLAELQLYFPERPIVLARELTKIYEEFLRGTARELSEHFQKRSPKGEFVVMIAPEDFVEEE